MIDRDERIKETFDEIAPLMCEIHNEKSIKDREPYCMQCLFDQARKKSIEHARATIHW